MQLPIGDGLQVGVAAPAFNLPDQDGKRPDCSRITQDKRSCCLLIAGVGECSVSRQLVELQKSYKAYPSCRVLNFSSITSDQLAADFQTGFPKLLDPGDNGYRCL